MEATSLKKIIILTPLYNDWKSYYQLQKNIIKAIDPLEQYQLHFIVVDDFSLEEHEAEYLDPHRTTIIHLVRNLGHQRALAIGLSYIKAEIKNFDIVISMDSDGEDKPEDIVTMLQVHEKQTKKSIIFAYRQKRTESISFKIFYVFYKSIFKILTGKKIGFGNFSLIPKLSVQKLVYVSELWNNYPSSVIKSRLAYTTIPTERGIRYDGTSKMNFVSLVMHGLSAVAVYIETVSVRLILFFIGLMVLSVVGIFIIICIKYFTNLAIPGWATDSILNLIIILAQAFIATLLLTFVILSNRNLRNIVPAQDYKSYILEDE